MWTFIIVGLIILLLIVGFFSMIMPDATFFVAQSVMTPEQVAATTVTVPYVESTINVIPIGGFIIIGFILIMLFALVRRK